MSKKPFLPVLVFLIAVLLTGGCNLPNTCDADALPSVDLISPGWGAVFNIGTDLLTWSFPLETCDPDGYNVIVSTDPDLVPLTLDVMTGPTETTLDPSQYLQPVTKYYWHVFPFVGETPGPTSGSQYFFTGPVCAQESLQAPILTAPTDSSTITTLNPQFEWTYPDPDCLPNGFNFRIAEDPVLTVLTIESDSPDQWGDEIAFGVSLADCKTYYYQVIPYLDGVPGPASEVQKFVTNTTGVCACNPLALPVPEPLTPSPFSAGDPVIVPVDMQVSWMNPGPCLPEGYRIELDSDFNYADSPYNGTVSGGGSTEYVPPTLEPANQYWWRAFSTFQGAESAPSNFATFFTGPECSTPADLTPPVILEPTHGAFLNTTSPMFRYLPGLPGCIPDIFRIELSTDLTFQGQTMVLEPAFTTTTIGFSDPLTNCTTYFLRVAAVQGGTVGPYSHTRRFFVNAQGTCFPTPIGRANQNVFCKIGPNWDFGVHLFNKDDWIQVVARNPESSYLEVYLPDASGAKPAEPSQSCWIPINAFTPDEELAIEDLYVNYPPDLPSVDEGGSGDGGGSSVPPECGPSLGPVDCLASGGWYYGTYPSGMCICPTP